MISNKIIITYNAKTNRLIFKVPFHLSDAVRNFPSRRFDPKSKTWAVPVVKANINYLRESWHVYDYSMDDESVSVVDSWKQLSAQPKHVPFPVHLYDFKKAAVPYDPMEHQFKMLDNAYGQKAHAWFAKMGTGKTFAAIHLACARFLAGEIDAVMIISPSTLRLTWSKEFAKYATVAYDFKSHDTKAPWLKEFYSKLPDIREPMPVLAVSVEGLGVSEALYDSACGFIPGRRVFVICDESSRIKNPDAKRTARAIMLGNAAEYRLILNGTPIALGLHDLWSQYEFLDPNIIGMGDYWAFKTRYIVMGGYENKQKVGVQNVEELMQKIIPFTTEVGKDVLNLPPKVMKQFYCEASKEQRRLFKLIIKGPTGAPDEPIIKVENVLEKHLRLQQVVGGWLPRGRVVVTEIDGEEVATVETTLEPLAENPKMDLLLATIEGNYIGSKFIVWTKQVHEIEAIRDRLSEIYGPKSVECYYGKTAMEDRSRIEDRYCNDTTMRFFIGNPVAAGLGLTLISGENDVMLYYTGTNAYIDRAQSEDRSHRIGQTNSVVVGDFIMERTVDVSIAESIAAKMDIEEYLMTKIAAGINPYDQMLG